MEQIEKLLKEYEKMVVTVCERFLEEINRAEKLDLKSKYDLLRYKAGCGKWEFDFDTISFRFHGVGCTAFTENEYINWDFGCQSRWCGFDPWKVAESIKKSGRGEGSLPDGNEIKQGCDLLVQQKRMFKRGDLYYFELLPEECFRPDFPAEYDELTVAYRGKSKTFRRDKLIERFVRKSTRVYKEIYEHKDVYCLRFSKQGKEVFAIPFDDRSYPESAVRLLYFDILKTGSGWNEDGERDA